MKYFFKQEFRYDESRKKPSTPSNVEDSVNKVNDPSLNIYQEKLDQEESPMKKIKLNS